MFGFIFNNRYYGIIVDNVFCCLVILYVNLKYLDYYKDVMFKYIKCKFKLINWYVVYYMFFFKLGVKFCVKNDFKCFLFDIWYYLISLVN